MFVKRKYDAIVIVTLAIGIFVVATIRPKLKLRPEMPAEFVAAQASWSAQKRAEEERIAGAYWECVETVIEQEYGFRRQSPLPLEPPPEFTVAADEKGPIPADPETRARYWRRLRGLWYTPGIWEKVYEWDFSWMSDPVAAGAKWLQDTARKILKYGNQ
jgi:hypothetical protein